MLRIPRAAVAFLVTGGALTVVHFTLPTSSLEQGLVYDLIGGLSVIAIVAGALVWRPERRLPWILLALGQASFVIGDGLWIWYEQIGESPFPSLADVFYLGGYPIIALGLVLFIRRRLGGGDRAGLLDAAILTTAAAVLSWTYLMQPALVGSDLTELELAITAAYPVCDLLLIGVAASLLTTPGARTAAYGLLAGSLVLLLVADEVYAVQALDDAYVSGGWVDGIYLASYLAIGAAALHPSMRALTEPHPVPVTWLGPIRLLFLAAAMMTGPAIMTLGGGEVAATTWVIAGGSALLSVLVLTRLAGLVGVLERDVAQRRVLEEQLSHQANHDPLTGLANRRLFLERVEAAVRPRPAASARSVALLFVDLDDFKVTNDDLGHAAGDALLRGVADRIRDCLRIDDLAARLGGDEFGILLTDVPDAAFAETVAARLVAAFEEPIRIGDAVVVARASIGIATAQPGWATADELLRDADVAMYRAKAAKEGLHRVSAGQPEVRPGTDRAARLGRSLSLEGL